MSLQLITNDGHSTQVDRELLTQFNKESHPLATHSTGSVVLPNIDFSTLQKVIEYCEHHQNRPAPDQFGWDNDYVNKLSQSMLFKILQAADELKITTLSRLATIHMVNLLHH
ncbi:hypothetical protein RSOLAG1IB_04348 [Rhizoctonia solani AG-1 IB]|uniref:SKP1 component POZ domain-containing protein n=1 Tax=Thanatephorus cucumeris (strain AG1-IB / isolate 7/3/14) TaxID=1108050 RepID=A0A0B7FZD3_THACB|nr:hypothetical protein RSOLAG1IB_04348 [Rhizoctonia solani AG-1 IB]